MPVAQTFYVSSEATLPSSKMYWYLFDAAEVKAVCPWLKAPVLRRERLRDLQRRESVTVAIDLVDGCGRWRWE